MIKIIKSNKGTLAWYDQNHKLHKVVVDSNTYINDDKYIFCMDTARRRVSVYDATGRCLARIRRSAYYIPMRLRKHQDIGIGIQSLCKEGEQWREAHVVFENNQFVKYFINKNL